MSVSADVHQNTLQSKSKAEWREPKTRAPEMELLNTAQFELHKDRASRSPNVVRLRATYSVTECLVG